MHKTTLCWLCLMLLIQSGWTQALVEAVPLDTLYPKTLNDAFDRADITDTLDAYKLSYTTPDTDGSMDTASGIVVIPRNRAVSYPVLIYMHGTVDGREDVPSRKRAGYGITVLLAANGYIAIAPDYLGLGDSRRAIHPYVHAESEASSGVDLYRAARTFLSDQGVAFEEQLFTTGYSQGGHASMALHQMVETNFANEIPLVAASHMSGPYSISGEMVKRTLGDEPYIVPGYLGWVALSYQSVYNNWYQELSDFFKQPYADSIARFRDKNADFFNTNLALIFMQQFGGTGGLSKFMLQDSVRIAIETDPDYPVNVALRDNDVYRWAPQLPTRLYYCDADEQVPGSNAILADSFMNALGAVDVRAVLALPGGDHGTCVDPAVDSTLAFFARYAQPDTLGITSLDPSSIRDHEIWVGPNPSKGELTLTLAKPTPLMVEILNMQGRKVYAQRWTHTDRMILQFPELPNGIYQLHLSSPQFQTTRLISLQRP